MALLFQEKRLLELLHIDIFGPKKNHNVLEGITIPL